MNRSQYEHYGSYLINLHSTQFYAPSSAVQLLRMDQYAKPSKIVFEL